ncbi:transposase [Roseiflexus castenholzii]|uniref:Transposase IS4 family protein n=1 Tax=Roseiflexus castenholzii (strain DSM 13941 / HLO8) TaxID=383372 RepID=A7NGF0_ROSCS|nr:transposase [Roseiflexus castenholzii]ABU56537.1 transposase IS4 family protein [Roseiflexus castenholzii DSM 13941]ABU56542.1 transposase IS4 family protein [Roseiflexus castenholzii DSM 13941]
MSACDELHSKMEEPIRPLVDVKHAHHLSNWLWIVCGILLSGSVALSKIALYLPLTAQAEGRIARIRRWLKNVYVDVWQFYRPLLEKVLQGWQAAEAAVILDGVMVFGDRLQIFRLSLRHGSRAIPLSWVVVPGKGLTSVERLRPLIQRAAEFLAPRVGAVVFPADRGFRDVEWAALCLEVGWHYVIRLANNTLITLEDGRRLSIAAPGVPPGEACYWRNAAITQSQDWPANLSVTWTKGARGQAPELLAVMSDRRACNQRLREYGWRMSIEESFRDDKSGGFDLEHTRLQDPQRLERLLLAVAIATLWRHELGEQALHDHSVQAELDPGGKRRELSIFQLGLRFLRRCLLALTTARLPKLRLVLSNLALEPLSPRHLAKEKCQ